MATWISHLRVAEYFRSKLDIEEIPFIVGNIGPDCGEPNEDWSDFNPPGEITHWLQGETKESINSEAFFEVYLKDCESLSKKHYSFYMGYYLHLLTDTAFVQYVWMVKKQQYKKELEADTGFAWQMKKDWYDLDHLYLKKNPDFYVFKVFEQIEDFPNDYLDYYSDTAMIRQIKNITTFYQKGGEQVERVYIYLTEQEMEEAIQKINQSIEQTLREKGLLRKNKVSMEVEVD